MSKLLEKMRDPSRSGVYRATRDREILDASRGSEVRVSRIALTSSDRAIADFASALGFRAERDSHRLEADLASMNGGSDVLVIENGDGHVVRLRDMLWSVARRRSGQLDAPFFAVFIDPARMMPLPDLFRGA